MNEIEQTEKLLMEELKQLEEIDKLIKSDFDKV